MGLMSRSWRSRLSLLQVFGLKSEPLLTGLEASPVSKTHRRVHSNPAAISGPEAVLTVTCGVLSGPPLSFAGLCLAVLMASILRSQIARRDHWVY